MKKLTLITATILSFTAITVAQENSTDNRTKLAFGLKAGLNYSNVYDSQGEEFNANAKFGLAAGATLAIPFGKYLGIQPEILVSQKGFKASGNLLASRYDFTRTTTYLDIPLQVALKPSEFITLLAGPQFSYLLNQRDVFTSSTTSYEQEQEFKNENIRKNIFGLVGGFDINLRHITLGARAGWDIQNNNGDGTATTPRYKNVWFQGTIGYAFYK